MLKKVSMIVIALGSVLVGFGGLQYWITTEIQENALQEAYKMLEIPAKQPNVKVAAPFNPLQGETIGILSIPKIAAELPIVEGTNEDELEKGVGHFTGTAYPTQNDQIVLSGHRDTVFRRMGELEIGDVFVVKLIYGSFTYQIVNTKIVKADDRSIIKSTAPAEVLVVTTCYPFTYVGDAPNRYIIEAEPVK